MPYTREDFQAAGIDPDSREAFEINQAAYEELARQDPTYGTTGKHATGIIPRMLPDDFWKIPLMAAGAGTLGEYLAGAGGAAGPSISGTATGSASGYSSALPVGLIEGATPGVSLGGLGAAPLSSVGAAAPAALPSGLLPGATPGATMGGLPAAPAAAPAAAAPAWQGPRQAGSTGKGMAADFATQAGTNAGVKTPMAMWKKLLIGGAISAGADAVKGVFQNRAIDKAEKAQQEATDKALALQKEQYEQGRADLAPYRNVGGGAIGTLGALMGIPQGGGGAPLQPSNNPAPPSPIQQGTTDRLGYNYPPGVSRARGGHPFLVPSDNPQARTSSSMVKISSPDGSETQEVPANQVDWWKQRGAVVL